MERLNMRNFLVTGGTGFIGSHIVEALVSDGAQVTVLDNLATGHLNTLAAFQGRIRFIQGDVCDSEAVCEAVKGIDCIFHEAAIASVPQSVSDPVASHHACATGTVNVLDQARRAKVRRVIYAASSSAYGNNPWTSKREEDLTNPLSPYAAAKLAGEHYCRAFYESYGLETVCLRYFNVFGPRQDPNGPYAAVIPQFIARMRSGRPPIIYGDGTQSRDFTYVDNVVAGNLAAARTSALRGQVFNIAMGKSYSLLELVTALNQLLRTDFAPIFEPARIGDIRESLADIFSAERELQYFPKVGFFEGLKRTVASFSSNQTS
jgi:UDP-glucose 4-epimerase